MRIWVAVALILIALGVALWPAAPIEDADPVSESRATELLPEPDEQDQEKKDGALRTVPFVEKPVDPSLPTIGVRVVDAAGTPITSTKVYWIDTDQQHWPGYASVTTMGKARSTDALGNVRIPLEKKELWIAVRHEGQVDCARVFDFSPDPVILRLRPYKPLRIPVTVLDADSRGVAKLRVQLTCGSGIRSVELAHSATDASGQATLVAEEETLRKFWSSPLSVDLAVPQLRSLRAPVPEVIPKEGIVLRLPPSGSLSVQVLKPSGGHVEHPVQVSIAPDHVKGETDLRPKRQTLTTNGEGLVVFPMVPADWVLHVLVRDFQNQFRYQGMRISGPGVGKTVHVEVRAADHIPYQRGRIIQLDGQPFASGQLFMQRNEGMSWLGGFRPVTTNAEGEFAMPLVAINRARKVRIVAWKQDVCFGVGDWKLPYPIPSQGVNLGEIRLKEASKLVDGFVEDTDGNPVPHLELRVAPIGVIYSYKIRTDEEGRFVAMGHPREGEVGITHSSFKWFRASTDIGPLRVPVGTSGVRFVVATGSQINIRLKSDPGLDLSFLDFRLGEPQGSLAWPCLKSSREEHQVVLTTKAEEPVQLSVHAWRSGPVVARVDNLIPKRGETIDCTVDLRGCFHSYAFEFDHRDGQRRIPSIGASRDNKTILAHWASGQDGFFRIVAPFPTLNLQVKHPILGMLNRTVRPTDRLITLKAVQKIHLALDHNGFRPNEKTSLMAIFTPFNGGVPVRPTKKPVPFSKSQAERWSADFIFETGGRYALSFELSKPTAGSNPQKVTIHASDLSEIDVRLLDSSRIYSFTIPEATIRTALQQLK